MNFLADFIFVLRNRIPGKSAASETWREIAQRKCPCSSRWAKKAGLTSLILFFVFFVFLNKILWFIAGAPVEFIHTITSTWMVSKESYYRHQVKIKNTSGKPISDLKLRLENLSGPIWGLSPTQQKGIYELPPWLRLLQPGSECVFIYIQEGPQAKVTVSSYH